MTDDTPEPAEKPKLTPANENPWYCLMTLHGEQEATGGHWSIDLQKHSINRRDWNKWVAQSLTDETRAALLGMRDSEGNPRFHIEELTPHNTAENIKLLDLLLNRTGGTLIGKITPFDPVDCSNLHFCNPLLLDGFIFPGLTVFNNSVFDKYAHIRKALFGLSSFAHTNFLYPVDFSESAFKRSAYFSQSSFLQGVSFKECIFHENLNFIESRINAHGDFTSVHFLQSAFFENTTFARDVDYYCSMFFSKAVFIDVTFAQNANFQDVLFRQESEFHNAVFKRSISFANARFKTFPPNFHEATLHSDTDWVGSQWPDPPSELDAAKDHVRYYQRLKQVMDTLKKHEDELDFFAREMRAQRVVLRLTGHPWRARLNWLYEVSGDYGRSVGQPLIGLGAMIVLCGIVYDALPLVGGGDLLPREALGLSIANSIGFLNFAKDLTGIEPKSLSVLARSLGVVQAGLGALFLFLAGLGLRNRFRMK